MNSYYNEFVHPITLVECQHWVLADELHHITGRYFSICGVRSAEQEYLLIRQPEIGLLAVLVTKNKEQNHLLLQFKAEPGNIPLYQWAPTVQATISNYERVHGGKSTPFLDYFENDSEADVIASEQGDRFLMKFNRNALRLTQDEFEVTNPFYRWIPATELKHYLRSSNSINTDLRSVLTSSDWTLLATSSTPFEDDTLPARLRPHFRNSFWHNRDEYDKSVLEWLSAAENENKRAYEIVPLPDLNSISIRPDGIFHLMNNTAIKYYHVHLPSREISEWKQPLFNHSENLVCGLLFVIENDMALFYLRRCHQIGFGNRSELGPSFQTAIGNNANMEIPEILTNRPPLLEVQQTDEGGRFFQNNCRYKIIEIAPAEKNEIQSADGYWLSLGQIQLLSRRSKTITNELRTCLSLLLSFI